MPTRFVEAAGADISQRDRDLVANAVDRSMCSGLSRRLDIVNAAEPADLSVQATITPSGRSPPARPPSSTSCLLRSAASLSSAPGSRSGWVVSPLRAEVIGRNGVQDAAMIWAGGANALKALQGFPKSATPANWPPISVASSVSSSSLGAVLPEDQAVALGRSVWDAYTKKPQKSAQLWLILEPSGRGFW